jgi:hypothetical protein
MCKIFWQILSINKILKYNHAFIKKIKHVIILVSKLVDMDIDLLINIFQSYKTYQLYSDAPKKVC